MCTLVNKSFVSMLHAASIYASLSDLATGNKPTGRIKGTNQCLLSTIYMLPFPTVATGPTVSET